MKFLLLVLLVLIPVYSVPSAYAEVQPLPSSFFCIGDNPQPPCITPVPTITAAPSNTCTPPTGCFKNGVMFCLKPNDGSCNFATPTPQPSNPSPSSAPISTNPSPSTSPCENNQSSVNDQSAGNASVQAFKKKGGKMRKAPGN